MMQSIAPSPPPPLVAIVYHISIVHKQHICVCSSLFEYIVVAQGMMMCIMLWCGKMQCNVYVQQPLVAVFTCIQKKGRAAKIGEIEKYMHWGKKDGQRILLACCHYYALDTELYCCAWWRSNTCKTCCVFMCSINMIVPNMLRKWNAHVV